jgi:hypothetical protein
MGIFSVDVYVNVNPLFCTILSHAALACSSALVFVGSDVKTEAKYASSPYRIYKYCYKNNSKLRSSIASQNQ